MDGGTRKGKRREKKSNFNLFIYILIIKITTSTFAKTLKIIDYKDQRLKKN